MALNNTISTVGIPSSSGYSVVAGLVHPVYSKMFTRRLYAESIAGKITSQAVVPSELRSAGDLAIMRRAPKGELHRYVKNQDLQVSTFNSETITFKVDQAHYWNLKLNEIDYIQVQEIGEWIKLFQEDSLQQLAAIQDHDIIDVMVHSSHNCNKGDKAGIRSHSYNLGKMGAPLALTANTAINPLTVTAVLSAVLTEQNAPQKGRKVVWPAVCQPLFLATPVLANSYQSGIGKSALVSGEVSTIMGVDHFFTSNTPVYRDLPSGATTYPVVMTIPEATGFVNQLTKTVVQESEFDRYWRGLNISGWGVVRPELIAVAYVTVQSII